MKTTVTRERLDGGTTLLIESLPHLMTAAVGFFIKFGSRAEEASHYGAAHFIEHLLFKGTATKNPCDIALAIESVGGSIGAAASEERTYCAARVLPEHIPVAISIISDMFFRSVFPEHEFECEKNVVLEEIKAHEDTPEDLIFDLFMEDVFGRPGLGHNILGYEENIKSITRGALYDMYRRYYRSAHLVVAVAGNIGDNDVPKLVSSSLEMCTESLCGILDFDQSVPVFSPRVILHRKDTEQVQICLGMPGVRFSDKNRFAYKLLSMILSGGMSSRLFQEVRERRGLVYDIASSNSCFTDCGFFSISAGMRPERLYDVINVTVNELAKIKNGDVSADELERMKEKLRVSVVMSFDSVASRMMDLADCEAYYGRIMTDEEFIENIKSVTLDDLANAANDSFRPDRLVFSALGPFKKNQLESVKKRIAEMLNAL